MNVLGKISLASLAVGLTLSGCYKKADKEHSDIAGIIPQQDSDQISRAIKSTQGNGDTLIIMINESFYKVTPQGQAFSPDGAPQFTIGNKADISNLRSLQRGEDIFFFYADKAKNKCVAQRFNLTNKTTIWTTELQGKQFATPIVKGQFVYVASNGFVGKIKLKNGLYEWRYNNLNFDGDFEFFDDIDFINSIEVRFVAPHNRSLESDTIIINDLSGEILHSTSRKVGR